MEVVEGEQPSESSISDYFQQVEEIFNGNELLQNQYEILSTELNEQREQNQKYFEIIEQVKYWVNKKGDSQSIQKIKETLSMIQGEDFLIQEVSQSLEEYESPEKQASRQNESVNEEDFTFRQLFEIVNCEEMNQENCYFLSRNQTLIDNVDVEIAFLLENLIYLQSKVHQQQQSWTRNRPKQLEIFDQFKFDTKMSPREKHFLSTENFTNLNENSFERQKQIIGEQNFFYERSSQKKRQGFNFLLGQQSNEKVDPKEDCAQEDCAQEEDLSIDQSPIAVKNFSRKGFLEMPTTSHTTQTSSNQQNALKSQTRVERGKSQSAQDDILNSNHRKNLSQTEEFLIEEEINNCSENLTSNPDQHHSFFLEDGQDLDECLLGYQRVSQSVQTDPQLPHQSQQQLQNQQQSFEKLLSQIDLQSDSSKSVINREKKVHSNRNYCKLRDSNISHTDKCQQYPDPTDLFQKNSKIKPISVILALGYLISFSYIINSIIKVISN